MAAVEDKEDEEEKKLDIELSGTVTFVVKWYYSVCIFGMAGWLHSLHWKLKKRFTRQITLFQ